MLNLNQLSLRSANSLNSKRSKEDHWTTLKYLSAGNLSTGSDECLNVALTQPDVVKGYLCPTSEFLQSSIVKFRNEVSNSLLSERKSNFLVIVGPEFLDSFHQAKACSQWLNKRSGNLMNYTTNNNSISTHSNFKDLHDKIKKLYTNKNHLKNLSLVMNVDLTSNYESGNSYMSRAVFNGVVDLRILLIELAEQIQLSGVIDDPICLQYYNDLLGIATLRSENIESQVHREFISGIPFPIGFNCFKSSIYGSISKEIQEYKIQKAIDAIHSVADPHYFLSVTNLGNVAIANSMGNKDTFLLINIQQDQVITLEHLKVLFDAPLNQLNNVKIILDLGKLNELNYDSIWNLLKDSLTSEIGDYIAGVQIDSGKQYIPQSWEYEEKIESSPNNNENQVEDETFAVLSENIGIKRSSIRGKIFNTFKNSYSKISSAFDNQPTRTTYGYEHMILADKFITQLNELMK
ncbi:Phospho-2-dehydro-3-deoxyheptonate aldolase,Phe-sensitive [Wickerhamomyces ciferrii]|uniref:3-deoxy-D-arabino-heptulosonate 7-phosphate synthase n=1 Tax=Wickerhamomyces ciferrii (strain ATCC 14091 / BCRC 22168 / CBS 111 / JCM 3599 / NBRC 0793 / NRRL Y-1031 F-60-10) TaxID=1206466 RepID=K0KQ16_WICCF|nr:Phospho-2-dehydro-3-deoxyheptonate aldolase,Phe-sensitive [Wickerhamomyces ciferrii]CCH43539.1 Phospho-2-dehydro-3-deoxyheptonate aldolase,Phe-sensitive [Wickerhamomyces ciferrii]